MAGRRMPVTARERKEFKRVMGQAERAMSAELAGLPLEHLSINPEDAFQQACLLWRLGAEQIPACMVIFVRTFA